MTLAAGMLGADGAFGHGRPVYAMNAEEPGRLPCEQTVDISRFGWSTTKCSKFGLPGVTFLFDAPPVRADKRVMLAPRDCLDRVPTPGPRSTR